MKIFKQESFFSGLNAQFDSTKISNNQYPFLSNGRIRKDIVESIYLPLEFDNLPLPGKVLQGIYGVGEFKLIFKGGKAFYKDLRQLNSVWIQIEDFQMSADASFIDMTLVPSSTINYPRILVKNENITSGVNLGNQATVSSPVCAICFDGINQPFIITPSGIARKTLNFNEWTQENREYVPIGSFSMFKNGILYVVAKDNTGRLTQILRSVSGRPLDFMVNIDEDGNKGGDAFTVSHSVDFNPITAIADINATDKSFFVSTLNRSYLVTPDLNFTIFGEPIFFNQSLFSTGALNQYSILADILGDTAMIDSKGIISFNAVLQAKNEGRNLPFSAQINTFFEGINQTITAAIALDNYAYFGVNTKFGPGIFIYDTINKVWVGLDIYPGVDLIKQFSVINVVTSKRLFFITVDNKLYEANASSNIATTRLYLGDWKTEVSDQEQKIQGAYLSFKDIFDFGGKLKVSAFVDGSKISSQTVEVTGNIQIENLPITLPFGPDHKDRFKPIHFNFPDAPLGSKIGLFIEWDFFGSLVEVDVSSVFETKSVAIEEDSSDMTLVNNRSKLSIISNNSGDNSVVSLAKSFKSDHYFIGGNVGSLIFDVVDHWDFLKKKGKVTGVLGNQDLDTANGKAVLQYLFEPSIRYYKQSVGNFIDVFVLNSGFKTNNVIVEPDGNTTNSKQGQWLKNQLKSSVKPWKIVIEPEPLYTISTTLFSGMELIRKPYRQWGANLVISTRPKVYERLRVDNLTYIVYGLGGQLPFDSFNEIANVLPDSQVKINNTFGVLVIEADKFSMNCRLISTTNEVLDEVNFV